MTSSSKEGHRHLHHDDPTSNVESSRESDPSFHGGNEDDNRENDNEKKIKIKIYSVVYLWHL